MNNDNAPWSSERAIQWAMDLLEQAHCIADPTRRAVVVTRAQYVLAWALRLTVTEAVDAGTTFRALAPRLGMTLNVLRRQYSGGIGMVAPEARQGPAELVVGFRTLDEEGSSWRMISMAKMDLRLATTAATLDVNGKAVRVELAHRAATKDELADTLTPLWQPTFGRRAMLLSEPVREALYGQGEY